MYIKLGSAYPEASNRHGTHREDSNVMRISKNVALQVE